MPLFAILCVDVEYLHPNSCTLVEASSPIAIAQDMIANPDKWKSLLHHLYPDHDDSRSLWHQIKTDALTPEKLLALISKSWPEDFTYMVRIRPVEIQSLINLRIGDLWVTPVDEQVENLD